MDFSDCFDDFLRSEHLQGKEWELTIHDAEKREFTNQQGQKDMRLVLNFEETPRSLRCNSTSAAAVGAAFGTDTEALRGKRVRLTPRMTNFGQAIFVTVPQQPSRAARPDMLAAPANPPPAAPAAPASAAAGNNAAGVTPTPGSHVYSPPNPGVPFDDKIPF